MSRGTTRKELGAHRRSVHPAALDCNECREKRDTLLAMQRESRLRGRVILPARTVPIAENVAESAARAFVDEASR